MAVGKKVRVYDLAKDLKQDTKRIIEELRREGADVSVPSNSVSKELAEKISNRYFPKAETTPKRTIKVIKRAAEPARAEEIPAAEVISAPQEERRAEMQEPAVEKVAPPVVAKETPQHSQSRQIKVLTKKAVEETPEERIVEQGVGRFHSDIRVETSRQGVAR